MRLMILNVFVRLMTFMLFVRYQTFGCGNNWKFLLKRLCGPRCRWTCRMVLTVCLIVNLVSTGRVKIRGV